MSNKQTDPKTKPRNNQGPEGRGASASSGSPFEAWGAGMKTWLDMWQKTSQDMTGFDPSTMGSDFYPAWFKMYDEIARNFLTVPLSGAVGDLYQKYVGTANIYTNLFRAWAGILENVDKQVTSDNLKDFLNTWLESQKDIFSRLFGLPLPGWQTGLPGMPPDMTNPDEWAKGVKQSLENWYELYRENYKPFLENWRKVSANAMEMMKPDVAPAKYQEFYDAWTKNYETTFGKFLKIPMVGPSRQVLDKIMKSVDAFIKFCGSSVDFSLTLYKPSLSAVEDLAQKASELLKGEVTPAKYKEFYEVLIKTFEEKFYGLFRTPAFTNVLKITLDAALDFRRHHFAVMEEMLKSTPVITRSEMDEVYKELYTLKKRIKELERLIPSIKRG